MRIVLRKKLGNIWCQVDDKGKIVAIWSQEKLRKKGLLGKLNGLSEYIILE